LSDWLKPEFETPKTLENWGNIDVFHFKPPWHTPEYLALLETVSAVMRHAFYPEKRIKELPLQYRVGYWFLNRMSRFRWRHKYFGLPFELRMASGLTRKLRGY
jgi:hypothetical protein